MEFIIELILTLALEGSIEASKNKKLPKWIRYSLIAILSLFFISIIAIVFIAAILVYKFSLIGSIIIFIIGLIMLVSSIMKFKKIYLDKENNI